MGIEKLSEMSVYDDTTSNWNRSQHRFWTWIPLN